MERKINSKFESHVIKINILTTEISVHKYLFEIIKIVNLYEIQVYEIKFILGKKYFFGFYVKPRFS